MRLCIDATRFGCGLKEAVELAVAMQMPALAYTFEPFTSALKPASSLAKDEKDYLLQVAEDCQNNLVGIDCINLNYCLNAQDKQAGKQFLYMIGKLSQVARALSCPRLSFWLDAGQDDSWLEAAEGILGPAVDVCAKNEVKPVLRLSTPAVYRGQSLKKWHPLDPASWRDLLSAIPALSLSFSPADCLWQGIDYLQVLPGFIPAIEMIEASDVELNRDLIMDSGLFGPLWWRYRLPGKGQVDWRQLVEALKLYGFAGTFSVHTDDEFVQTADLQMAVTTSLTSLRPFFRG